MLFTQTTEQSTEHELDLLTSGIIGIFGVGLLLIPSHLNRFVAGMSTWVSVIMGIMAFALALSLQITSTFRSSHKPAIMIRWLNILFLFLFAFLAIRADYFIDAIILILISTTQAILATPLRDRFIKFNLLQTCVALIGFFGGLYLILNGDQYAGINLTPYRFPLAAMLMLFPVIWVFFTLSRNHKFNPLVSRLLVIPWLIWCAIFTPPKLVANLIAPAMLCMVVLFEGFIPWNKLAVARNNVLGRKVVMIISTLEMAMLIFLGALFIVIDNFAGENYSIFAATHEGAFLFFILISIAVYFALFLILVTVNGIMSKLMELDKEDDEDVQSETKASLWNTRLAHYIEPFINIQEGVRIRLLAQTDQIGVLTQQVKSEKKRNAQLTLLLELSQQLENQLDQPVAAQLAVNSLERALGCSMASLYVHEPDEKEFMLLAAAGQQTSLVPAGFRQKVTEGALGRAVRQRKTQIINDIELDADYIKFENEQNLSAVIVPLIFNGHVNGAIVLNSERVNAFSSIDIGLAEAVAAELSRAWERSSYHQRLMNLVQAGSQLSAMVEPAATTREIATIAREILQARFTFVQIQQGQERNFTESAYSGEAPRLLGSLQESLDSEALIKMAFNAVQPFRVRDVRKYSSTSHLMIDNPVFRSMLAIPIRWHRLSIGVILAFGKQNEVFFNENDESLAELLSIQAAGAFESAWLQQELRTSLRTTSLLYHLSNKIIQVDNLKDAARDIAQTAHKLAKSITTGVILFNAEGDMVAEVEISSEGIHGGTDHPMEIIRDVMVSGQLIYLSRGQSIIRACLPIQTPIRTYGAVWMDMPENQGNKHAANPNDLQALVSQTAIALERSLLLVESQRQAVEIKAAYDMLESTYDQTLAALMSALDARDRETEGHSLRVSHLAAKLGKALNFSHDQLKVLERGSLLHDIGKIGISDTILHKPGPLNEEEWKIMKLHPDIGAKIVAGIPFLQDTIPLIRHHQERWDGTGYPDALYGEEIPILARMFAIVDAFDALTSKRPYREKTMSTEEALDYLRSQSGILFDPNIIEIFETLIKENQPNLLID